MKRLGAAVVGLWGAAVMGLAGCAPTAMGPMVMRLGPGAPDRNILQLGMRSGPRLSAPIAGTQPDLGTGGRFQGNESSFSTQQWGMAFDGALTVPLSERLHLHTGVQGEMFLPVPLPAYGVYAGASYYVGSRHLGLAPALSLRGATDFGLMTSRGGPGSLFGAEVSCAFTMQPEKNVSIGLVPFASWHTVSSVGQNAQALYYGGVVAARISWGGLNDLELSGGFGRAKVGKGVSWNVPIMGARGGR
ncbi:hypothetical protein [Corallococcus macrosporus]|uniref:Lipoprotein n=1 Tax=Corallococcus macrosporus DSM 14697 TaxID=1189310 RepID=A0A250JY72_9BACT|nr:hypothetical protein [Corallococcus macrosporus]ATB48638.1 lipoprotein [Corallococcus macrosporus DSM 14697]